MPFAQVTGRGGQAESGNRPNSNGCAAIRTRVRLRAWLAQGNSGDAARKNGLCSGDFRGGGSGRASRACPHHRARLRAGPADRALPDRRHPGGRALLRPDRPGAGGQREGAGGPGMARRAPARGTGNRAQPGFLRRPGGAGPGRAVRHPGSPGQSLAARGLAPGVGRVDKGGLAP